jgi:2OG-Fe(II) oxygenase superfamily
MSDFSALSKWIRPDHLARPAADRYRDDFAAHPGRMIVLKDFLVPPVAEKLSAFLAEEADFEAEYGVYSTEGAVTQAEWEAAPEPDRFFRYSRLVGIPSKFQMSPNALTYLRFRTTFHRDATLRAFFAHVSGQPLEPSDDFGSHRMDPGDFLRPHDDNNRDRRLALVLYLSPAWEPGFGGTLHVIDDGGTDAAVDSEYNSLVLFDTRAGTQHFVDPVRSPDGRPRLSIGGWYH